MRAIAVIPRVRGSVQLIDKEVPEPSESEVLFEVLEVGICGTDRDIIEGFYGRTPHDSKYLVIGHESLCRIYSFGRNVSGFRKGELVVPTVRRECPERCLNCRNGESDMCLTGNYLEHGIKGLHGFASDYAVSDCRFVVKLPESLLGIGVLLEPLAIVEKGLAQILKIQKSRMKWEPKRAIVLGAGPVGLLATAILRLQGLEVSTVATRPITSLKARIVESMGARYIDTRETQIKELEQKYDIVFELTGNVSVAIEAQKIASVNGIVCYLGIYKQEQQSEDAGSVFTNLVLGNRVYFGSVNANKTYFEKGVTDMIRIQKEWPGLLARIITDKFTPEDYKEAYSHENEDEIKSVIIFRKEGI